MKTHRLAPFEVTEKQVKWLDKKVKQLKKEQVVGASRNAVLRKLIWEAMEAEKNG